MKECLISLVSGLIGVIIGFLLQLIHDDIFHKKNIRQNYKKICIEQWLNFIPEIGKLIESTKKRKNVYFREGLLIRIELLASIGNTKKSKKNIDLIIKELEKYDDSLSIKGTAEKAFSDSATEDEKQMFEVEIYEKIREVIEKIQFIN